jgi:D-glycero-alpha-D-manno-heptose-7-phosphate kinase
LDSHEKSIKVDIWGSIMFITRTPFRITFGGGGTDLPSFYKKHGGFIFCGAIDKYMFISVNRPIIDDLIRIKYSESETMSSIHEVRHDIARECCKMMGIERAIEIISMADVPAGTGLGSSSCYAVGLLNALHSLKRDYISLKELAEEACSIEIDILKKPIGKQDHYIATFGGLMVLEIDRDGTVEVRSAGLKPDTIERLESNILLFYEGTSRNSNAILADQSKKAEQERGPVVDSMFRIKEIGRRILKVMENGQLNEFGELMHEHWMAKKRISDKMSNFRIDEIYEAARASGALGGKIMGAGGGGFFMFYCENSNKYKLRKVMQENGLRELRYHFDFEGTKVLANF